VNHGNAGNASHLKRNAPKVPKSKLSPKKTQIILYDDPSMPQPPPDLTLASTDIIIIKYCGVTGVILAGLIFCCQVRVKLRKYEMKK
jgi:hypothetical protein